MLESPNTPLTPVLLLRRSQPLRLQRRQPTTNQASLTTSALTPLESAAPVNVIETTTPLVRRGATRFVDRTALAAAVKAIVEVTVTVAAVADLDVVDGGLTKLVAQVSLRLMGMDSSVGSQKTIVE